MRRSAWRQWFDGLMEGDPFALGLLGIVVVLALFTGAIWLIDQKRKKDEAEKKSQGRRSIR